MTPQQQHLSVGEQQQQCSGKQRKQKELSFAELEKLRLQKIEAALAELFSPKEKSPYQGDF
jgi:hypothetical protein